LLLLIEGADAAPDDQEIRGEGLLDYRVCARRAIRRSRTIGRGVEIQAAGKRLHESYQGGAMLSEELREVLKACPMPMEAVKVSPKGNQSKVDAPEVFEVLA
jgi:hypothetical protein